MEELAVQAERLPGIGWRYTLPADDGRQLLVVVEDRGPRHLVFVDPRLDEPLTTVRLRAEHAPVLAALLTGARFAVVPAEVPPAGTGAGEREVVVKTVPVADGSRAVGRVPDEIGTELGPDAALLGVIDDGTPELVEVDGNRAIRAGDRLVVAVRRGQLPTLRDAV